eukprot:COSAG01_NODE_60279_length_295_cov_1.607143_1_plen_39_part_01
MLSRHTELLGSANVVAKGRLWPVCCKRPDLLSHLIRVAI